MSEVRIIASPDSWIEGEAVRQLEATAAIPGIRRSVGMPDLHPGKGSPNGAAFLADRIFPSLVGTDDGCGIGLWLTDALARRSKIDRLVARLDGLDAPWSGDVGAWLATRQVAPTAFDSGLGTPGHGNHFIEVQQIAEVVDAARFAALALSAAHLYVMVHSGSRRFGEMILHDYAVKNGANGVFCESPEGQDYLAQSAHAIAWAAANRALCAHRVFEALAIDGRPVLDICHNSVTPVMVQGCQCWLHRKGAAPADQGPVVIPGSRNDLSFIVQPVADREDALWSLAHGAGRKIARGDAQGKLAKLYRDRDVRQNRWGGRLVCGERALLLEEAAECYKDITAVIADLQTAGLIAVIATLRPLVTFKTSEGAKEVHRAQKSWQREREAARTAKRAGQR